MINPLDSFTRVINGAGGNTFPALSVMWIFVAEEDLTLRSVTFGGTPPAILSTDPNLSIASAGQTQNEFQVSSMVKTDWQNLVFPVPKGSRLYYGIGALQNDQVITLILT